jgi:putative transposase
VCGPATGRAWCRRRNPRTLAIVPAGGHQPRSLALLPLPAEPADDRGDAGHPRRQRQHETIQQWARKFGQGSANQLRRRLPRAGDEWHLDEVVITVVGRKHWLWQAVDQDGSVFNVPVQSRHDKRAAERLLRKLLKRQMRPPCTGNGQAGELSHGEGGAEAWGRAPPAQRSAQQGENAHQPTRRCERQMKRFKSPGQAQRFLFAHDQVNNLFHLRRDHVTATWYRAARAQSFAIRFEIAGANAAA